MRLGFGYEKTCEYGNNLHVYFILAFELFFFKRKNDWNSSSIDFVGLTDWVYLFFGTIAVLVLLFFVGLALAFRKYRKTIALLALVLVAAVASVGLVWFTEASIDYYFESAETHSKTGDNYITINCENTGYMSGIFNLVVQFTNANFSSKTSQPYQQVDSQTAKFTYTLQSGESQSAKVYFSINDNAPDFYISLNFQQNADFLVKSNPGWNNYRSYQKKTTQIISRSGLIRHHPNT